MPNRPPLPNRRRPSCTSPASWRGVIAGLLAGAVLVAGCGKKAGPSSEAPEATAADASPGFETERYEVLDGLGGYENELAGYEDQMLAIGLPLPGAVVQARTDQGRNSLPAGDGGGDAGGPRCERICGLATNICELRERICTLGAEHQGEPRYEHACERATLDCEHATAACEGCDA